SNLSNMKKGIVHRTLFNLHYDDNGQITEASSISAVLDYPGVGPDHSHMQEIDRINYTAATDKEALDAFKILSKTEGIIPALESAHAVAYGMKLAKAMTFDETLGI